MSIILNHSDDVSGTTIFNDGTKIYWTEGRSSDVVIKKPDGTMLVVPSWGPWDDEVKKIMEMEDYIEQNADEYRQMTPEEEKEWNVARYGEEE